jgi:hypothetical protein
LNNYDCNSHSYILLLFIRLDSDRSLVFVFASSSNVFQDQKPVTPKSSPVVISVHFTIFSAKMIGGKHN